MYYSHIHCVLNIGGFARPDWQSYDCDSWRAVESLCLESQPIGALCLVGRAEGGVDWGVREISRALVQQKTDLGYKPEH